MGEKQFGIDNNRIATYAKEIKEVVESGVEVAIVIGGGNIFRGIQAAEGGMERSCRGSETHGRKLHHYGEYVQRVLPDSHARWIRRDIREA